MSNNSIAWFPRLKTCNIILICLKWMPWCSGLHHTRSTCLISTLLKLSRCSPHLRNAIFGWLPTAPCADTLFHPHNNCAWNPSNRFLTEQQKIEGRLSLLCYSKPPFYLVNTWSTLHKIYPPVSLIIPAYPVKESFDINLWITYFSHSPWLSPHLPLWTLRG